MQTEPVKKQDDNASENQLPVEIWIQNRFFFTKMGGWHTAFI